MSGPVTPQVGYEGFQFRMEQSTVNKNSELEVKVKVSPLTSNYSKVILIYVYLFIRLKIVYCKKLSSGETKLK